MRLFQILNEATTKLVDKLLAFYKHLNDTNQTRVIDALEKLEVAVASPQVWNADFNEIKEVLSRTTERSLDAIERAMPRGEIHDEYWEIKRANYELSTYVNLNETGKQIRELKKEIAKNPKCKQFLQDMLEVNEAGAEIFQIFKTLKPKIVKGRRPSNKPVDPNAFHQKMGSKEAQEIVLNAVKKEISEKLDTYQEGVEKWLQRVMDSLEASNRLVAKSLDDVSKFVLQQAFDFKSTHDYDVKGTVYTEIKVRKPDFAKKEAAEQREGLEKRFLFKNLKKLSHIVELKGNLKEIKPITSKPVNVRAGSGTLEAGFRFTFSDNSEFTVVNKIVTKYSYRGKPFEQFPTTFHDVKMPDGSKLGTPSEEKMVKEFAK